MRERGKGREGREGRERGGRERKWDWGGNRGRLIVVQRSCSICTVISKAARRHHYEYYFCTNGDKLETHFVHM